MFGRIVLDLKAEDFDEPFDELKAARRREARHRPDRRRSCARSAEQFTRDRAGEDRASRSRPIRIGSSSWPSAPSSTRWFGKRAHDYREFNKIPHDLGTAVNVVTMVFGNMGDDSGTGVAFTRDPNTGEKALYGEYLTNAQGEDVVAGVRTPAKISQMRDEMPEVYAQFEEIAQAPRGATTATCRTSSSRSSAASSTCSRPDPASGPRRPR